MTLSGARNVPTTWSPALAGVLATVVGYVTLVAAIAVALNMPLGADGKGLALLIGVIVGLAIVGATLQTYCARCARPNPRVDAWVGIAGYVLGASLSFGFAFGHLGPLPVVWLLPWLFTALALRIR